MRLLVVEDDGPTASGLVRGLAAAGYVVDHVADGTAACQQVSTTEYAAVVLDVVLPGGPDGVTVCRQLRRRGFWGAVVMLTARDSVDDRVTGLDAGADDYLLKPFSLAELEARLRSSLRRGTQPRPAVLRAGDVQLDPGARRCWRGPVEIELSRREFDLLEVMVRNHGQTLSRRQLLERVWDDPDEVQSNVVDQYVRYLRRKVDEPFGATDLRTVRGLGYRFQPDPG
ncbi:response regulator transcription factor [Klenkia sp. PcliD-1-E]|uniref:response regulator transcription factor n=1 Tax=Klenkia sp. PcliD-1-E TaxID=2954492 RepID=UPI0020977359|nr:response regulator transcription factor [Klenkia sp. PcliD-1-E]MCO7221831.1 response regulator transcription factor [Klenkia sp. PcliD-1-E]